VSSIRSLSGKTILLAGGTGFFGRSLLLFMEMLNVDPAPTVFVLSRKKSAGELKFQKLKVCFIESDVSSIDTGLLPEKIDYIIHAATTSGVSDYQEGYLSSAVIDGTKNLLMLAEKYNVRGFLFVSSGAVYDTSALKRPFKETDKTITPGSSRIENYAILKRKGEILCEEFWERTRIPVSVARSFAFTGRSMNPEGVFALTSFVKDALTSKKIHIHGSGQAVRSYLDQDDLARWLLEILLQNSVFDIVNVGSPKAISLRDLALLVSQKIDNVEIDIEGNSATDSYYVPDVTKASSVYGLAQSKSLDESLEEFIAAVKVLI
jgi:nucleoside-diphosphate-sugar epimerase